jgi:hypothetical protein
MVRRARPFTKLGVRLSGIILALTSTSLPLPSLHSGDYQFRLAAFSPVSVSIMNMMIMNIMMMMTSSGPIVTNSMTSSDSMSSRGVCLCQR